MEKNKLEIKHLACYLPYGLKMINTKSGRIIDVRGLTSGVSTFTIHSTIKSVGNSFVDEDYQFDLWPLRPILRPLSEQSLLSEITHNSETFIPLHRLLEASCFNLSKMDKEYIDGFAGQFTEYDLISYRDAEMLFEWHFDVFGLIDNELAIDINTLTNEH